MQSLWPSMFTYRYSGGNALASLPMKKKKRIQRLANSYKLKYKLLEEVQTHFPGQPVVLKCMTMQYHP